MKNVHLAYSTNGKKYCVIRISVYSKEDYMEKFFIKKNIVDQDIWRKLTAGNPRRIKYSVNFLDEETELVFETSGNNGICVYLAQKSHYDMCYFGKCRSILILSTYGKIFCGSEYDIVELFDEIKFNYNYAKYCMRYGFEDDDYEYDDENDKRKNTQKKYGACYIDSDNITRNLKSKIVGQDNQLEQVVECVSNHLKKPNPKKPVSIMLSGPTGVGKTATAKYLAEELAKADCGFDNKVITINCNEYTEEYRISQLFGSPAGYAGYDDKTVLEPIRKTNSLIILLDEYEKAHSNIHVALMSIFDNGVITLARADENGVSEYDCSRCIIMLTSNIKTDKKSNVGFACGINVESTEVLKTQQSRSDECRQTMVDNGFKPEIASRIGYFVEYRQLSKEDMHEIMNIAIKNSAKEYGIEIANIKSSIRKDVVKKYGATAFGVRALISDIGRLIGKNIVKDLQCDKKYILGGTLEKMVFTSKEQNEKRSEQYKNKHN
ncbi:MAG: AAA family ATPase [Bacillota bacterium]